MATATETLAPPITVTEGGIWSWITTVDHKRIGTLYGVSGFTFFLVGGVEAMLIRTQLAVPQGTVIDAELYNQLFSIHALTMIFLAIMPMGAAFFNWMVPLMIGARDVAFPRLNALSYWIFLAGALLLTSSFLFGGAPDAGWFAYAPLTESQFSPGRSMDFYVLGLLLLGVSSMAAALNFAVTIINMRAPGMTMMRLPVFIWMTFVVILPAHPRAAGADRGARADCSSTASSRRASSTARRAAATRSCGSTCSGCSATPRSTSSSCRPWASSPRCCRTFSRKPLFGYATIVFSRHRHRLPRLGRVEPPHVHHRPRRRCSSSVFAGQRRWLIGIPTGIKVFNWLATMWGGNIRFTTSMYFAVAFVAMFTIGGISGVMHASPPVDHPAAGHVLHRRATSTTCWWAASLIRRLLRASTTGGRR